MIGGLESVERIKYPGMLLIWFKFPMQVDDNEV